MGSLSPASLPSSDPVEPPRSSVTFPSAITADERGRVHVGGDLEPGALLAAYRAGLFPMRQGTGELAWWSPDPRAIIIPDQLHVSASLRRAARRFTIRIDTAFEAVIKACAERDEGEYHWITTEVQDAFVHLHQLGWAHSVEAWTIGTDDEPSMLAGGLYGVAIGGLFSGESMFHRRRDASKVALVALAGCLVADGRSGQGRIIDVQWLTPHMASLGAFEISRNDYLTRLSDALSLPLPAVFGAAGEA